jgi:hypothetical protein
MMVLVLAVLVVLSLVLMMVVPLHYARLPTSLYHLINPEVAYMVLGVEK